MFSLLKKRSKKFSERITEIHWLIFSLPKVCRTFPSPNLGARDDPREVLHPCNRCNIFRKIQRKFQDPFQATLIKNVKTVEFSFFK